MEKRTDLALEARELWQETAGAAGELPGVQAETREEEGFAWTTVRILDEQGERIM